MHGLELFQLDTLQLSPPAAIIRRRKYSTAGSVDLLPLLLLPHHLALSDQLEILPGVFASGEPKVEGLPALVGLILGWLCYNPTAGFVATESKLGRGEAICIGTDHALRDAVCFEGTHLSFLPLLLGRGLLLEVSADFSCHVV